MRPPRRGGGGCVEPALVPRGDDRTPLFCQAGGWRVRGGKRRQCRPVVSFSATPAPPLALTCKSIVRNSLSRRWAHSTLGCSCWVILSVWCLGGRGRTNARKRKEGVKEAGKRRQRRKTFFFSLFRPNNAPPCRGLCAATVATPSKRCVCVRVPARGPHAAWCDRAGAQKAGPTASLRTLNPGPHSHPVLLPPFSLTPA